MAQGQISTTAGLVLFQLLIQYLGSRRTGMTGPQKMTSAVDIVAPLLPVAAGIASDNSNNPAHKAELMVLGQGFHDALSAAGQIHDTAALEAGTPMPTLPPISLPTSEPKATP